MALVPQRRLVLHRTDFICRSCRAQWARQHSTARKGGGGLDALRSKLQPKNKSLHELPKTPARTRFAPSPTGYLHVGSLRTALYNWLLARATGGQFLIRVEDTDQTRIVEDAVPRLLDDLKWAQLDWDEGPDAGGPYGPYVQSKRLHLYHKHAEQLLDRGHAYRCFCTAQDLERHKQQSLDGGNLVNYPGTCRTIPPDQAARRAAHGESHVVRFRSEGRPSFTDLVYGHYQKNEDESDFILIKTDGFPTYHFANVVDDHLMKITHVIRGVEWLISTPKHVALYNAFNWTPPAFAHAGLLCGPNGEKLSKRNRDIDIDMAAYRDKGILPSALNNWLALLGWSPDKNAGVKGDVFPTMADLAQKFSLKFTKGNAQTNPEKLPVFQRAHLTHLLRDPSAPDARLKELLVVPLLRNIQNLEERRLQGSNADGEGDLEATMGLFSQLVPQLSPSTPRGSQESHILALLKTLASDPKETAIDPAALLTSHPSLFFRPDPAAAASSPSGTRFRASLDANPAAAQLVANLEASLCTLAEGGNGGDRDSDANWNPDAIQACISAVLREAALEVRTTGYAWLRYVLSGDPDRPAKPAKLQLAVLGPEEALVRLRGAASRTSAAD
ncbi:glutamyl-tRNA synthetase [Sodiomyces alkalinus F11]|uniref:Glutamate--tRNA ligase, mitochondrial n=1 Tax=Sodiomyces alkalinus (strain CBS 110278 / VKM F-3762 / F11) TaxID=1314773 RepID=A0A3N2Q5W0_SODAK|nr:glutamyl-tRNA synthetase [Sodiomyces alkalinus F11]ROT42086.1 glutamyl-tRNA synthetase [Sodiomyces alkalinus F11]